MLDRDRILNATFDKRILASYNRMKENGLTKDLARDHYLIYKDAELSDIFGNAFEYIYKEPYYGRHFIEDIIVSNQSLSPEWLYNAKKVSYDILDKMESINNIPDIQRQRYIDTAKLISGKISEFSNTYNIIKYTNNDVNGYSDYNLALMFKSLPISNASEFNIKAMELCNYINNKDDEDTYRICMILKILLDDEGVIANIDNYATPVVRECLYKIKDGFNTRDVYESSFNKLSEKPPVTFTNADDAIDLVDSDELLENTYAADNINIRKNNAKKALAVIEPIFTQLFYEYMSYGDNVNTSITSAKELFNNENITTGEALSLIEEKYNDLYTLIESCDYYINEFMYEFNKDGSQSDAIKSTVPDESKTKKKIKSKSSDDTDTENEDNEDDDSDDTEDNTNDEIEDKRSIEEKRPKVKNLQAIQNKAMDLDMKSAGAGEAVKKGLKAVGNTFNAIGRVPNNIIKGITGALKDWETTNDEKKKKEMLKPGYRNNLFRLTKKIFKYGLIAHFSKALAIVVFICKHTPIGGSFHSKEARLRNELVSELDSEIEIVTEKINDASSNGDKKEKYELMRIKKKLEDERMRVNTNSEYI